MNKAKKALSLMTVVLILCTLILTVNANETQKNLSDIENHWAKEVINQLIDIKAIDGYDDGTFKPNNTITRAEFSTIVRKAFKHKELNGNSFDDTNNHWAKNEIHTLVEAEVINKSEYGTNYEPNKNITKLEMAKMIVRVIGLEEQAKDMVGNITKFYDNNDIPSNDRGYIIIASDNKIINGYPDQTFKPFGEATRAEASTMIINAFKYLQGENDEVEVAKDEVDEFIDADSLPKKSFEEIGLEDIEEVLKSKRVATRWSISYKPKDIIEINDNMFPLRYESIKIESYRFEEYEDTFIKGTNAFYWGMGRPVDMFFIEGEIMKKTSVAAHNAIFLDENNDVIDKKNSYYIAGNQVNDPMNKKALENYPNLHVTTMGLDNYPRSGKVTLMYMLSSEKADKVKTVLLYYKGHPEGKYMPDVFEYESDVLKFTID